MFASSFWNYFTLTTRKASLPHVPVTGWFRIGPLLRDLVEIPSATAHSRYSAFLVVFLYGDDQPLSTLKRRCRQVAQALEDL